MYQYEQYSSEKLAMDSNFQEWVLRPTDENEGFWQEFIQLYPQHRMVVEEAIDLVRQAGLTTDAARNTDFLEGWSRIEKEAGVSSHNRWISYAAAVAFAAVAASALYFAIFRTGDEQYRTSFGETQRISLSDGSEVLLNANTSLIVNDIQGSAGSRTVTLDGDAFFDVQHTPDNRPFVVRTPGNVEVQVLGTTFEINQNEADVEVLLKTGEVKVVSGETERLLRPGQLAIASPEGIIVSEPAADVSVTRLSWVEGQYVMNEFTLEQVTTHISEHFGKRVVVADRGLLSTTVSGKVPANDLPVLLEVLKQTLHLNIKETDGTLYIRRDVK